jgi:hypothetical protein
MSGPDGWCYPGDLEEDLVALDDALGELGASGELRAEVSDQWREIALLGPNDPTKPIRVLAAIVETLPFLEAELRAAGYEMLADRFARLTAAGSLWLELPTDLAAFAGPPNPQYESEET